MRTRPIRFFCALLALVAGALVLPTPSPAAADGPALVGLVQIDAGSSATCGVFGSGVVTCWGNGADYGLGNGSSANRSTPTTVAGITNAVQVAVGASFACALLDNGTVKCWGDNEFGQLGLGTFEHPNTPVTVVGLAGATHIAAGLAHVCAVLAGGTVKCWGNNQSAQIGFVPVDAGVPTPTTIGNLSGVTQLTGGGMHTCALKTDATMRCWGGNTMSQIGNGTNSQYVTTPTSPTGLSSVIDISAGYGHNCVIVMPLPPVRTVKCWGQNDSKQTGTTAGTATPHDVDTPLTLAADVDAYGQQTCVALLNGTVFCFGDNTVGQLGNAAAPDYNAAAVQVTGLADAIGVAVGALWACAVLSDQTTECWGSGYSGRLGRGNDATNQLAGPVTTPFAEYNPVTPARLLDTRSSGVTIDGVSQKLGVVAGGSTLTLQIRNRGGVPGTTVSVAINLTVANASALGYATVWPCSQAKPLASNINFIAGVPKANMVIARITTTGADTGKICISPSVTTHLIVDVMGYYRSGGAFTALSPARLFDSRANGVTVDGLYQKGGPITDADMIGLTVLGRGGVPASGVKAVAYNITATNSAANGLITVYPCSGLQPVAHSISTQTGVNVANLVVVGAGDSLLCIRSTVPTHFIVDVVGYFTSSSVVGVPTPTRISDSRPTGATVDNQSKAYGKLPVGSTKAIEVITRGPNAPTVSRSVVVSVTVYEAAATGYLTVWPCGQAKPNASNVNMAAGVTNTATVMVAVGDNNEICVFSSVSTHLTVDLVGAYFY
ncbi:MAG: hypothetical protein ABMA25_05905 [Ilumatobacteraceae bacterium]